MNPRPRIPDPRATAIASDTKGFQREIDSTNHEDLKAESGGATEKSSAVADTPAVDMRARALEVGAALAPHGLSIFRCEVNGKRPARKGWQEEATADPDKIGRLWTSATGEPESWNIGIYLGERFFAFDVDTKASKPSKRFPSGIAAAKASERYKTLIAETGDLPPTITSRSATVGSRGIHLILACPPGVEVHNRRHVVPGVDVRGAGGYIVAPGSIVDGVEYIWEKGASPAERKIGQAPQAALDLCHATPASVDRLRVSPEPLCDLDLPRAFEQARTWLRDEAPEATEGSDGRGATMRVIQKLGDFGLSAEATFDVLTEEGGWNETKADPPWATDLADSDGFRRLIDDLWKYHRKSGAGSFFPPDVREVFESRELAGPEPAAPPATAGRPYIFADEGYPLALAESVEPLVEGWLDCGELSCFYGRAGSGKSFVAIGIAMSIAWGVPWAGCATTQGLAFYVAMEGGKGLLRRLAALRKKMDLPPGVPFVLSRNRFDLSRSSGANELAAAVKQAENESGQTCRLIVLDTVARAIRGNDSDPDRMSAFLEHCDMVRKATGAHVLLIHHAGKIASAGARGSTLLLAAVDTEALIAKGVIKNTKQRELEDGKSLRFTLETVELGMDPKGRVVTSAFASVGAASVFKESLTRAEQWALDRLTELRKFDGAGGALPVSGADWNRAMEKAKVAEGGKKPSRASLSDWRAGLVDKMAIRLIGADQWVLA